MHVFARVPNAGAPLKASIGVCVPADDLLLFSRQPKIIVTAKDSWSRMLQPPLGMRTPGHSLLGSSAVLREASPEGSVRGRDAPWPKDQAAFLEPPASTSTPIKSLSFMIMYSTPSSLTSVPDHLPNSTRSPTLTSIGMSLPLSSRPPGPTAMTSPS